MPKLAQLKPGSRILSFEFDMQGAKPQTNLFIATTNRVSPYRVFRWIVPWEPEPDTPAPATPRTYGR
jgi:hypothetical protein